MADHPLAIHPFYEKMGGIKKFGINVMYRTLPFPAHVTTQVIYELYMWWVRIRSKGVEKRFRGQTNLLINLGAGDQGRPGWVNVDALEKKGVNCVYDCRLHLPFDDMSGEGIFCEHFFEHLDYDFEALPFLKECYRVLRSGGVLRLIVPDAQKYLDAYCADGWEEIANLRGIDEEKNDPFMKVKYETKMQIVNNSFRQGFQHKYGYDFDTLKGLLKKAGFQLVVKQEFGVSTMSELCLDWEARSKESLYVDGIK